MNDQKLKGCFDVRFLHTSIYGSPETVLDTKESRRTKKRQCKYTKTVKCILFIFIQSEEI